MLNLGKDLAKYSNEECLKKSEWLKRDLVEEKLKEEADLVIVSYVLNEMKKEERIKVLEKNMECYKRCFDYNRTWNSSSDIMY